jgi:hypothetical protein
MSDQLRPGSDGRPAQLLTCSETTLLLPPGCMVTLVEPAHSDARRGGDLTESRLRWCVRRGAGGLQRKLAVELVTIRVRPAKSNHRRSLLSKAAGVQASAPDRAWRQPSRRLLGQAQYRFTGSVVARLDRDCVGVDFTDVDDLERVALSRLEDKRGPDRRRMPRLGADFRQQKRGVVLHDAVRRPVRVAAVLFMFDLQLHQPVSGPVLRAEPIDLSVVIWAQQNQVVWTVAILIAHLGCVSGRTRSLTADVRDVSPHPVPRRIGEPFVAAWEGASVAR